MTISRRSFLKTTTAVPFGMWLQQQEAYAQHRHMHVRYNVMSPHGQRMLKIYHDAVHAMMGTPEANPIGWLFQWYTHGVKPDFAPQSKANEIARIYNTTPPPPAAWKALAQSTWNTCEPHAGGDENFFLPWHRMFVFYFERIVRKVSKHENFTLPYWNYSDAAQPSGPRLPNAFINPGNSGNPLWRHDRYSGPNSGSPIDQGQPDTPLNLDSLKQCAYKRNGAVPGFCQDLDVGLHATVHVLVGTGFGMGSIPWAAYDPIFWMHHCNVDRLWASWNHGPNARQNPTDAAWLNQSFTFANEHGHAVTARNSDVDSITKLRYTYDIFEPLPACAASTTAPNQSLEQIERRLIGPGPVELGRGPTRVPMQLSRGGRPIAGSTRLSDQLKRLNPGQHLYLLFRGLRAQAQPEVLYHVYVNLPEGTNAGEAVTHHVGIFNFFEAVGHASHQAEGKGSRESAFFSFDISERAPKLQSKGILDAEETNVTIVPIGEPAADAKPSLGEIAFVAQ